MPGNLLALLAPCHVNNLEMVINNIEIRWKYQKLKDELKSFKRKGSRH